MKLILMAVLAAALVSGTSAASETADTFAFWNGLLKGEVAPQQWELSEEDSAGVAASKALLRNGLGRVLARCEWAPARERVKLQSIDGSDTDHIQAALYMEGEDWYAAFVAKEGSKPFRFFFPEKRHQYDVLANRYAGHDSGAGVQLLPGRPYILALFPHKVTGMSLDLEPKSVAAGETVRLTARLAGTQTPGTHVFRLRVVGPRGEEIELAERLVIGEEGVAEATFDVPGDIPPGKYSVSARCAATAAIAAETLSVEP